MLHKQIIANINSIEKNGREVIKIHAKNVALFRPICNEKHFFVCCRDFLYLFIALCVWLLDNHWKALVRPKTIHPLYVWCQQRLISQTTGVAVQLGTLAPNFFGNIWSMSIFSSQSNFLMFRRQTVLRDQNFSIT